MRFGDFVAVDHVDFRIERGEIFGFLGSNGCGKTTTMKMLTGLLPASEGEALLFGQTVNANDMATRKRVGYMSQSFSLYAELSVRQNLVLHAQLFHVPATEIAGRVTAMAERFSLGDVMEQLPERLPLAPLAGDLLALQQPSGPDTDYQLHGLLAGWTASDILLAHEARWPAWTMDWGPSPAAVGPLLPEATAAMQRLMDQLQLPQ